MKFLIYLMPILMVGCATKRTYFTPKREAPSSKEVISNIAKADVATGRAQEANERVGVGLERIGGHVSRIDYKTSKLLERIRLRRATP